MIEYAKLDAEVLTYLFPIQMRLLESQKLIGAMAKACNQMCHKKIERMTLKRVKVEIVGENIM